MLNVLFLLSLKNHHDMFLCRQTTGNLFMNTAEIRLLWDTELVFNCLAASVSSSVCMNFMYFLHPSTYMKRHYIYTDQTIAEEASWWSINPKKHCLCWRCWNYIYLMYTVWCSDTPEQLYNASLYHYKIPLECR